MTWKYTLLFEGDVVSVFDFIQKTAICDHVINSVSEYR